MEDQASIVPPPVISVNLSLSDNDSIRRSSRAIDLNPVIDLTGQDSSQVNSLIQSSSSGSNQTYQSRRSRAQNQNDDDDIIYTGQIIASSGRSNHSSSSSQRALASNSNGNRSTMAAQMASITASIYAGYISSTSQANRPPQQGSSALTIRDSPPPQTRRLRPNSRITLGGGGRFSGGRFRGLITTDMSGLRGINTSYHVGDERLESMFSNWTRHNHRSFENGGQQFIGPHLHTANFLTLAPHNHFFASIYGFDDDDDNQDSTSFVNSYEECHSHPLKIKTGFSKEIIPLDREVLTLDSDSPVTHTEKQELRPICACCQQDLMLGQDSSAGGLIGRRPWILACGHIVDSWCLEQAKIRLIEAKRTKIRKSKESKLSTPSSSRNKCKNVGLALDCSTSSAGKKRRLSSSQSPASSSQTPIRQTVTLASSCATRRRERAEAREARKSNEFLLPVASNLVRTKTNSDAKESLSEKSNSKGKAKEIEESLVCSTPKCSTKAAPKDLPQSSTLFTPTWIQCPVKGCRGAKGDLLAPIGSKNGPWEIFI
ncbi:hypothetical protein O181_069295 [Austropuccinia psidii MF-1]|uniref:Uncharacterized protein n=1 Tax=Austropuccinia psidii MF-1 TaxID=1389203 RepID=A0A9Q3F2Q8_9BASI|nr:hypothetical protein [Austropuccinia psidii MF-1]